MHINTIITKKIFLTDIDYSSLKQALDYAACKVVDTDIFSSLYHSVSYDVPADILTNKWATIYFVVNLLQNDYQTILW